MAAKKTKKEVVTKDKKEQVLKEVPESQKIWEEIKDFDLGLFAMSGTFVHKYLTNLNMPGDRLLCKVSVSAVIPALENVFSNLMLTKGKKYFLESGQEGVVYIGRVLTAEQELTRRSGSNN